MKRFVSIFYALFSAALLFLTGCMGYTMGGTTPEGIKTVHVAPVINKTTEPAIELKVSQALRQRIQFDGRLNLENSKYADAAMEITLTNYRQQAVAYDGSRTTSPREYRIVLIADGVLRNVQTGEVISQARGIRGEATFEFASDLTTAKRTALPVAAADLARFMHTALMEQW